MAMLQCLRGIRDDGATVHGFRAAFSTWAREQTDFAREIVEAALANTQLNAVIAAYAKTTFLDRRHELLAEWAGHCVNQPAKGLSGAGAVASLAGVSSWAVISIQLQYRDLIKAMHATGDATRVVRPTLEC